MKGPCAGDLAGSIYGLVRHAAGFHFDHHQQDVIGTLSSQYLLTSSLSSSWALFIQTLSSNYNDWYNPYNVMGFATNFGRQNLSGWQQSSKQDQNSVATNPGNQVPTTYCGILD